MADYIATFFSHFGAIRFKRLCDGLGWTSRVMPVPRTLSSSCGTCVQYQSPQDSLPEGTVPDEIEQVVRIEGKGYVPVYRAENA